MSLIDTFDSIELHKELGAVLDNSDDVELLSRNMLTTDDVLSYIKEYSAEHTTGTQTITSFKVIDELGLFGVLVEWNIDYDSKTVDLHILDNKVLDIENKRVISDNTLCTRIYHRVNISQAIKDNLFA